MNRPPKRELVARMRESRRRRPALLIHEAEPFKGLGARPDVVVAHEGELGDGEPIAGRDVMAVGGGEWDHDFAGGADFFGWVLRQYVLLGIFRCGRGWDICRKNFVGRAAGLRIGPGLRRAVSFMKLSR